MHIAHTRTVIVYLLATKLYTRPLSFWDDLVTPHVGHRDVVYPHQQLVCVHTHMFVRSDVYKFIFQIHKPYHCREVGCLSHASTRLVPIRLIVSFPVPMWVTTGHTGRGHRGIGTYLGSDFPCQLPVFVRPMFFHERTLCMYRVGVRKIVKAMTCCVIVGVTSRINISHPKPAPSCRRNDHKTPPPSTFFLSTPGRSLI